MISVSGADLRVGDTIEVWWSSPQVRAGKPPRLDVITGLRPYTGSLTSIFSKGAQLADFMYFRCGMTIYNNGIYLVKKSNNGLE